MQRSTPLSQRLDWLTTGIVVLLMMLGLANILSATGGADALAEGWDASSKAAKQLMWIGVCGVLAFVLVNIEGEFFIRTAILNYVFHIFLLLAVLVVGKKIGGARSWFGVGSISLQPSEWAKPATALMLAWFLSRGDGRLRDLKTRFLATIIAGFPAGLILMQPDAGTVLVFLGFVFTLYREGLSGNVLIVGFCALVLAIGTVLTGATLVQYPHFGSASAIYLFWLLLVVVGILSLLFASSASVPRRRKTIKRIGTLSLLSALTFSVALHGGMESVLKPHQKDRIYVLFGIDVGNPDADYNIRHAKAAIGSGGWGGKGFLSGPMTAYGFVPEQETDFIFCTVGEEWGFIGSSAVVLLLGALMLRLLFIAERQRSHFTRIYAYGVVSILFMHFLINIGMVLGLAPVIGIPLPFFSYGGSSLIGFTTLIFILLRLDAERFAVLR
ncbi:MAG: rod shape-determining protein RodA [Flavobacteriales bacterium]